MKRFLLLLGVVLSAPLMAANLAVGPVPGWVQSVTWDPKVPMHTASGDYEDLVHDIQVNRTTQELHIHFAFRMLTAQAVQDAANLSINYDPTFQSVTLNQVLIWRDGQAIDQSKVSFQSIRQEKDRYQAMYDGREAWVGFLKDVRPGDILEVAYTTKGDNPLFQGKYADWFDVESAYAVDQWTLRILSKAGKSPEARLFRGAPAAQVGRVGDLDELRWDLKDVPRLLQDQSAPIDEERGGRVLLSDWPTWSSVVGWALPSYRPTVTAEITEKARALTKGLSAPEEKFQALLQFVQDDIRYLGVEIGMHSHLPHAPAEVLTNGFGDCKDKAMLFAALSKAVGLEAWPVLVNTRTGSRVSTEGPTPLAFNHVIAAITMGGKTQFVDPTAGFQGRRLADQVIGSYAWGLELRDGVTDLTRLPGPTAGVRRLVQTYRFDDYNGPATVEMKFAFEGSDAVYQRSRWASMVIDDWKKDVEDWLYDQHGSSSLVSGPTLADDPVRNVFSMSYQYKIDALWTPKKGHVEAEFYPTLVGGMLYDPDSIASRQSAYWREHPVTVEQERRIVLPTDWNLDPINVDVKAPGFLLTVTSRQTTPRLITMKDTYQSTADRIQPAEWKDFLKKLKQARNEVYWTLTYTPPKVSTDRIENKPSNTTTTPPVSTNQAFAIGATTISVVTFLALLFSLGSDF